MSITDNHNVEATKICVPPLILQAERVYALYAQVNFVLLGNLLVALVLTTYIYQLTHDNASLYWMLCVVLLTLVRYASALRFSKYKRSEKQTIRWGWLFALLALISGCMWGATSILFLHTDEPVVMLFLLMTLTGIVVASSAALSNFVWAYYAFAIPAILPFGYMLFLTGQTSFVELGMMLMIFLALQLIVAKKNQNTLDNAIILKQENVGLIEALRDKNTKLESANAAKTRFLAAASHDLRQPLHAMSLFIDALGDRGRNAEQTLILDKLRKSSSTLTNLLESLLDISKLDAGVVVVNRSPFRIQAVFDVLSLEFDPLAREKGLEILFMPTTLWADSDEKIVVRILRNLISNAIRYTNRGRVLVGCRKRRDKLALLVGDTGIGIAPEYTEIIFEEFRQLDNPSRDKSKGLGLGLSIVKRLSELLSAELSLRSISGRGSLFSIQLPRCSPNPDSLHYAPSHVAVPDFTGRFVLIVEDDAEVRDAIQTLLIGWGCRIVAAESTDDAKQKLTPAECPELILADLRLYGEKTGIDAIHDIQDYCNNKTIPAVIITGDIAPDRIKEIKNSGFMMVHKPVSGGKLRALLNSILTK